MKNLTPTASVWRGRLEVEFERRRRAKEESVSRVPAFGDWLKAVNPTWNWDWAHLAYIREQLDRLTRGEIKRLMVLTPPRHGKTEHGTVRYPVWRLEREPHLRVVLGAYNQILANKFSRKARRVA